MIPDKTDNKKKKNRIKLASLRVSRVNEFKIKGKGNERKKAMGSALEC